MYNVMSKIIKRNWYQIWQMFSLNWCQSEQKGKEREAEEIIEVALVKTMQESNKKKLNRLGVLNQNNCNLCNTQ